MFKFLIRTSWQHMTRMPFASLGVIVGFAFFFFSLLVGLSMLSLLAAERSDLESRFTYPLALSPEYTTESPRVSEFTESLSDIGMKSSIQFITREQALDQEISEYPAITGILSGENPFPDMIIIPLQGVSTDRLWTHVQSFRDIFETGADSTNLRMRLEQHDKSIREIREVWMILLIILSLIGVLMLMLLLAILRYHLRLFQDEREVGRLVGADPIFIWGPHVIAACVYVVLGAAGAFGLFRLFEFFVQ